MWGLNARILCETWIEDVRSRGPVHAFTVRVAIGSFWLGALWLSCEALRVLP